MNDLVHGFSSKPSVNVMEETNLEQDAVDKEIGKKAKEWIEEYGEEFLIELIDAYLEDAPDRVAQLRGAFNVGNMENVIHEAHTLKSSSANIGAMRLSALAKQMELAGRNGKFDAMAEDVQRVENEFERVKTALEALKKSPGKFVLQER